MKEKTNRTTYKEMLAEVAALAAKVAEWRQRRTNREAMPTELWAEAAWLGRRFGIYPISRDLNLHYGRLKRLVDGQSASDSGKRVAQGGFMELRAVAIREERPAAADGRHARITEV